MFFLCAVDCTNIDLVASAKEEVGVIDLLYFTNCQPLDAFIALAICPLSSEYPISDGEVAMLLSQGSYRIYDEGLNTELPISAKNAEVLVQLATINGFGSDASIAMKFGYVAQPLSAFPPKTRTPTKSPIWELSATPPHSARLQPNPRKK